MSAALLAMLFFWPVPLARCLAPAAAQRTMRLSPEANQAFLAANAKKQGVIIRPDGLQFQIIQNGFGKRPDRHRHGARSITPAP